MQSNIDIPNIKKGLHDLFPLFHLLNNQPLEYVFDINTQEVLSTFLILENIDYGYPLYVKLNLHTGLLSECYPMFYKNFKMSIDLLYNPKNIDNLKNYFSIPIQYKDGKYSLKESTFYEVYYPDNKQCIIRKYKDEPTRTYIQCNKLSDISVPIYWKTRDLIINSDPDYIIFYFKNNSNKPDKLNLGINILNKNYKKLSKLVDVLQN